MVGKVSVATTWNLCVLGRWMQATRCVVSDQGHQPEPRIVRIMYYQSASIS